MQPYPLPNSVLVMDNTIIHHFNGIQELVEARQALCFFVFVITQIVYPSGCKLVYLVQYSPDLNPIEEGFSCMKAWIQACYYDVLAELQNKVLHLAVE